MQLHTDRGWALPCHQSLLCLQAVLQYHPGLEFLADTPEFQARYAETVIYRIFYTVNRCALPSTAQQCMPAASQQQVDPAGEGPVSQLSPGCALHRWSAVMMMGAAAVVLGGVKAACRGCG